MVTAHELTQSSELNIKKVAVLTDFSQNAGTALRFAAILARGCKADIVLAHAYIVPSCAYSAPRVELVYQTLRACRANLESQLLMEIEASYLRDIHCTIALHQGAPEELLEVLKGVDLIVVGTSGGTGFSKATLGSIAETIFRSSAVPVLTVGPHCGCSGTGNIALDTVLYATDFSPGSAFALPYAVSIARRHAAKLVLLHVTNDQDASFSFERTMASAEPLERLRKLVPYSIDLGYEPTYVVGFGAPGAAIIEEAENCKADVIVIGARGTSTFASAVSHFGGGTAYHVASEAPCPVLTIRYS